MPRFLFRLVDMFRAPDSESHAYDRRLARMFQRREDIEKRLIDDMRELDEVSDQLRQESRRNRRE